MIILREVSPRNHDRLRSVGICIIVEQARLVGVMESLVVIDIRTQELWQNFISLADKSCPHASLPMSASCVSL
jgi:hypothetical protein